jgi:WhiB family transcriptional regulator, redox-sensing transcriptional regulator
MLNCMFNRGHRFHDFLVKLHDSENVPCTKSPELFFPEDIPDKTMREYATLAAKSLCHTCPLFEECFEYATTSGEPHGIWAGTLPGER